MGAVRCGEPNANELKVEDAAISDQTSVKPNPVAAT